MSLFTTQGYRFRLVAGSGSYADKVNLDLFVDEDIFVSNNILNLFDIAEVPGTFTRTLTLPGTKINNAFFEQYYDISVYRPDLFQTNQKVEAYLDFDGIYLVNGYMQLNKVSVYENKFVDSYEITLFGIVSSFSIDAQRLFLTELDNLSIYNHTSSLANITSSWNGGLFNGDIVYALTDSGTNILYTLDNNNILGIDDVEGSLTVQDFKPAMRMKTIWDACFQKLGYTYTSSFFDQPWIDDAYLVLNNNLRYPVYGNVVLENYGQAEIGIGSGSINENQTLTLGVSASLGFDAKQYDYNNVITLGKPAVFNVPKNSSYQFALNLVYKVTSTGAGSGMPAFYLYYKNLATGQTYSNTLAAINTQNSIRQQNATTTINNIYTDEAVFRTPFLEEGQWAFWIEYINYGTTTFSVTLNPKDSKVKTTLKILKTNQGADWNILDVPLNMPFGVSGIKIIDFIRGIQKKFNLVMYQDITVPNQFKVETFNTWYRSGEYKDFNQYINLNEKIEFIPANTEAVNKLNFTDTQDADYVSTLWQRTYNRTFGQAILIDTGSYFSQGQYDVKSVLSSGPITLVPGSIYSGSYAATGSSCLTYDITNLSPYGPATITYTSCDNLPMTQSIAKSDYAILCVKGDINTNGADYLRTVILGGCAPTPDSTQYPVYIPYYINGDNNGPARVLPRLFFYNGLLRAPKYYMQGYFTSTGSAPFLQFDSYPYFDNYNVLPGDAAPSTGSLSLLYNNETPPIGSAPTASLVDTYYQRYLELLYNPRTRIVNAAAVIPLADYFDIELNDVVQFRSNYYHLRAINDYNLTTGQCLVQMLGPIIPDTVSSNVPFIDVCGFTYNVELVNTPPPTTTTTTTTSTTTSTTTVACTLVTAVSLYGGVDIAAACANTSSGAPDAFACLVAPFDMYTIGAKWYLDSSLTTPYPTGSYATHNPSLGTDNKWVIIGSGSIVESTGSCIPPTTTTTSTSTTTTTNTTTTTTTSTTTTTTTAYTPPPTTTTTTTSTTTSTTTGPYEFYLADRYMCIFPGCSVDTLNVVVSLPTGTVPQYDNFYPPVTFNGYSYRLKSSTSASSGVILKTNNYGACFDACEDSAS